MTKMNWKHQTDWQPSWAWYRLLSLPVSAIRAIRRLNDQEPGFLQRFAFEVGVRDGRHYGRRIWCPFPSGHMEEAWEDGKYVGLGEHQPAEHVAFDKVDTFSSDEITKAQNTVSANDASSDGTHP